MTSKHYFLSAFFGVILIIILFHSNKSVNDKMKSLYYVLPACLPIYLSLPLRSTRERREREKESGRERGDRQTEYKYWSRHVVSCSTPIETHCIDWHNDAVWPSRRRWRFRHTIAAATQTAQGVFLPQPAASHAGCSHTMLILDCVLHNASA